MQTIVQFAGLQRSGNHAIINFLTRQFRRAEHLNNVRHDVFEQTPPEALAEQYPDADLIVVSFEDTAKWLSPERPFHAFSFLAPERETERLRVVTRFAIRHPFNCWASRVEAQRAGKISADPDLGNYVRAWLAIAEREEAAPGTVLRYEAWANDEGYRRRISADLGGTFTDEGMHTETKQGGGSTYTTRRQSRLHILKNPAKYARVFVTNPLGYARAFLRPMPRAEDFANRVHWNRLVGDPAARALLENETVRAHVARLYGPSALELPQPRGRAHPPLRLGASLR